MRNPRKEVLHATVSIVLIVVTAIVLSIAGSGYAQGVPKAMRSSGITHAPIVGSYRNLPSASQEMVMYRRTVRVLEIQKAKEGAERKAEAIRKANLKAKQVAAAKKMATAGKKVSGGTGSSGITRGNWKGTHAEWDRIARATLVKGGCSSQEVEMMMYIHHHEGGPNSISPSGTFHGGWQLKESIAHTGAWWDPAWSTARALRYVRGHVYKGYGSGVKAAYLHKLAKGWY